MTWRETPPRGWIALTANSLAVLYGIAFLAWALTVPDTGGMTAVTWVDDYFDTTGLGLLLASQSLLISVPVWVLLHRHCRHGSQSSLHWAAAIVTLAAVWAFIGGFSLSHGLFPAACLLVVASLLTPAPQRNQD